MPSKPINKKIERQKNYLRNRQAAYQKVFAGNNDLKEVMEDLTRFCRGNSSCFDPDARVHSVFEGRREVYLRIKDHLELSFEELWLKYAEGAQ